MKDKRSQNVKINFSFYLLSYCALFNSKRNISVCSRNKNISIELKRIQSVPQKILNQKLLFVNKFTFELNFMNYFKFFQLVPFPP